MATYTCRPIDQEVGTPTMPRTGAHGGKLFWSLEIDVLSLLRVTQMIMKKIKKKEKIY